jgi:hypothetical protein
VLYFRIKIKSFYGERIASDANGEFVPNASAYFSRIRKGEILFDAPVFDYFHLQSFDKEEFWDWKLCDIHGGGWEYPGNNNWYISDKLKLLMEHFKITPQYYFYESRLLYRGEKLKYWIFQFIAAYGKFNKMKCVDFSKSIFALDEKLFYYNSIEDYVDKSGDFYEKLKIKKITLNSTYDFIPLNPINSDIIVSERLRTALEINEIEGFEFSELDYEVIVAE